MDTALAHLAEASKKNPSRGQYFMVKGEILREKEQYKEAMGAYRAAKEDYYGMFESFKKEIEDGWL